MNWSTFLSTIGHQNRASILNKFIWSWLCPANGDTYNSDINTRLNLTGTTTIISCLTLYVRWVL